MYHASRIIQNLSASLVYAERRGPPEFLLHHWVPLPCQTGAYGLGWASEESGAGWRFGEEKRGERRRGGVMGL